MTLQAGDRVVVVEHDEATRTPREAVQVRRQLTERGINTVGPVVSRKADRGEAWNIRVTDAAGVDVTQEFGCFRD